MASKKVFAFEEVCKHSKHEDCWVIISGKVYDVSPFLDDHPGGDEVLLASTAKDATKDFEDIGHSESAKELMNKYCIGEIDASTVINQPIHIPPPQTEHSPKMMPEYVIKILQFIVPILILGLAFIVRQYTKKE